MKQRKGAPSTGGWMPMGQSVPLTNAPKAPAPTRPPARMGTPQKPGRRPPPTRRRLAQGTPPETIKTIKDPPQPEILPGKCPGTVQMPDGRQIQPGDGITFRDFCELLPFLAEAMHLYQKVAQGINPGSPVPLTGKLDRPSGTPIASPSQFGPASGVAGDGRSFPIQQGGAGGFIASGGGGPGPAGRAGPPGPPGPAGLSGGYIESASKSDGDFMAGPGSLVPVPGTKISFKTADAGYALFLLHARMSGSLALRINGSDHGLNAPTHGTSILSVKLSKGTHEVEALFKGVGGTGTLEATPDTPVRLAVIHR